MNRSFLFIRRVAVLVVALIPLFMIGCRAVSDNPPAERDGQFYGVTDGAFRGRWWNYYERGQSFADGGFWGRAERDFRKALSQWDGDMRRVRTYGRHLIDYFPHRELGVTLFHQDQWTESIGELERSLNAEPSAKARYYLDRARKEWIDKHQADLDPPSITIDAPADGLLTDGLTVTVTGTVRDDTFVSSVSINDIDVRMDLSQQSLSFTETIPLDLGDNEIRVHVRDLSGKSVEAIRRIHSDRIGPVVNIDGLLPDETERGAHRLTGYAHDRSGISEIRVDGRSILDGPVDEIVIDQSLWIATGKREIQIEAVDQAGNSTLAAVAVGQASTLTTPTAPWPQGELFASRHLLSDASGAASRPRGINTPEKRIRRARSEGHYHAVIIGIDDYQHWSPLSTAANDAKVLMETLIDHYGFDGDRIVLLTNQDATYSKIMDEIRRVAQAAAEPDSILVFYAGHGQLDDITGNGYWVPVDGQKEDESTWLTHSAVKEILGAKSVRARHVLIIADSCYSGTFLQQGPGQIASVGAESNSGESEMTTRGQRDHRAIPSDPFDRHPTDNPDINPDFQRRVLELARKPSRQVIASGGVEPVEDLGREGHSRFAYHLLQALHKNPKPVTEIEYLFNKEIWHRVVEEGGQRPVIGRMKSPTDAGGQFILVKKTLPSGEFEAMAFPDEPSDRSRDIPPTDTEPPVIEINKWPRNRLVFTDQALLAVRIKDPSGVQSVSVNGEKVLKRPGHNLFLSYLVSLEPGENPFTIDYADQIGNRASRTVSIIRKQPKVFETGARMTILPLPSELEVNKSELAPKSIDTVLAKWLSGCGRFQVIDTDHWLIRTGIDYTPGDDLKPLIRRAIKDDDVEFTLKTKVNSGSNSMTITADVTELQTNKLVTIEDVYVEGPEAADLETLCKALVVQLQDALPLAEGRVVKVTGDEAVVSVGTSNGIKRGMHLLYFEEGEPLIDPATGQSLGADVTELGSGRIVRLRQKVSHSQMLIKAAELQVGHRVVTK